MELQQDFRDLLALFNARRVEYVVVGAYALAFHGAPRFTGDMDLLVRPGVRNGRRIIAARGLDFYCSGSHITAVPVVRRVKKPGLGREERS